MMAHLTLQGALVHPFGDLLQKTSLPDYLLRRLADRQLIDELVRFVALINHDVSRSRQYSIMAAYTKLLARSCLLTCRCCSMAG